MGNTTSQWRATIGCWSGGTMRHIMFCTDTSGYVWVRGSSEESSISWYWLLVAAVLLIVSGVEQNPGPDSPKAMRKHYKKTSGAANMTGELYEVKMIALLFCRVLSTGSQFQIASNMEAAGKFDDIMLNYNYVTIFFQLKHRKNTANKIHKTMLTQEKGDFNLLQYYRTYCHMKEQWKQHRDLQMSVDFKDVFFIVYTNTGNTDIGNEVRESDWMDILSSGGKRISFTEDMYPLQFVDRTEYKQFLSQLWFFTDQSAEDKLDDLIRAELKILLGTDRMYTQFLNQVLNWWKNLEIYLTPEIQFWQDLIHSCLSSISEQEVETLSSSCLTFHKHFLMPFSVFPSIGNMLHICTNTTTAATTSLTVLKVHQSLSEKHHLLIRGSTLQARQSEVTALWGRWCDLLVVIEDGSVPTDFLHSYPDKRLVYISGSKPQGACTTLLDKPDLCQLDKKSQTRVLAALVNFQGHNIPLGAITGSNLDAIPADAIMRLLTCKVVLGDTLTRESDYYIPRTLELRHQVEDKILSYTTTESPVTLAVSGILEDELEQLISLHRDIHTLNKDENKCKIIIINTEKDFSELTELCKSVHWLHRERNVFFWKKSRGDMTVIHKYLRDDTNQFENVDSVLDVPHRVVLISAEPRMGKSTLLTHLVQGTKQSHPDMWIIQVNLSDFTQHLKKLPENLQLEHVIEFLLEGSGMREEWKPLFRLKLTSMENVCVLFDEYDEIYPSYADKVTLMLKCLQATKLQSLWITTRPIMREKLEQELGILTFSLKPFSTNDQKNFLFKFWRNKPQIEESILNKFISDLLQLTKKSLSDMDKTFTEIPLQSLLLAEIFEDDARTYCERDLTVMALPHRLDLLQLYTKFVDRKLQIYCDKNNVDTTKSLKEKTKINFKQSHMILGLISLFPSEDMECLYDSRSIKNYIEEFEKNFLEDKENVGLIQHIVNCKPVFIHKTFAEYYAALWFSKHLFICYLNEKFFDPSFKIVRHFFDRILAKTIQLHTAVLNYDKDLVQTLLKQQYLDVNIRDEGGRTALHLAIMCYMDTHNNESSSDIIQEIIEILLNSGADPSIEDKVFCWTPLRIADRIRAWPAINLLLEKQANDNDLVFTREGVNDYELLHEVLEVVCTKGFVQLMAFMLQCGIPVGQHIYYKLKDSDEHTECTILHAAAACGHLELVQFLVHQNADINSEDSRKQNPLYFAAFKDCLQIVQYLIANGATVNTRNNYGSTPLHAAVSADNLKVVQYLIEHDASITARDNEGCTPLYEAARRGNLQSMHYLTECGASIAICDNEGCTPLHEAARWDQLQVVQYLVEKGATINVCDNYRKTPLHAAASWGNLQVVQYFIEKGATIDACDNQRKTPLHEAARWGNLQIMQCLIKHGANITAYDNTGCTPLLIAARWGNLQVVQYLIEEGADINVVNNCRKTPLHAAARWDHLQVVQYLIEKGATINICDNHRSTPLHITAKWDNLQSMQYLIQHNASITACDNEGCTPLHVAARWGNLQVVQYLIEKDATINACDNYRKTPLHESAIWGNLQVVQCLIEHGASISACDNEGYTPLHIAARWGNSQVVQYLIKHGASVTAHDNQGHSPLHIA